MPLVVTADNTILWRVPRARRRCTTARCTGSTGPNAFRSYLATGRFSSLVSTLYCAPLFRPGTLVEARRDSHLCAVVVVLRSAVAFVLSLLL